MTGVGMPEIDTLDMATGELAHRLSYRCWTLIGEVTVQSKHYPLETFRREVQDYYSLTSNAEILFRRVAQETTRRD
jgi:hypothetical protein